MIVELCSCPSTSSLSNNHRQEKYPTNRFHMAMNKPSVKQQNSHLNTNENRTDDDYGGGGNSEISS